MSMSGSVRFPVKACGSAVQMQPIAMIDGGSEANGYSEKDKTSLKMIFKG